MDSRDKVPAVSVVLLAAVILLSVFAGNIAPYSQDYMSDDAICKAPCSEHFFGTDTLGRDLFTMVLYGGRASLIIGILSAVISAVIAVLAGTVSGLCGRFFDAAIMRICEIMMSMPSILLIIFLQAIWGNAGYLSLSVIIGVTSWSAMAKVVRSEVRQLRQSDYILAAKMMDGGFFYILKRHFVPGLVSSTMFMAVSNIGSAIMIESTLSFLGLGLPLSIVSWGSLMAMSQEALLSGCWWLIVIPGTVLVVTIVSITRIGEYVRKNNNRLFTNL